MKIERNFLKPKMAEMKKEGFDYLVKITAVDYVTYVEAVYVIRNIDKDTEMLLEVDLDPSDLWLPTMLPIYKASDWYERELQEMFGIEIKGRRARRLLLEKWDGKEYPLRKSFKWNAPYATSE